MADVILDLCGGTGSWSKPYKAAGYRVISVDTWFGRGDVRLMEFDPDLMPVRGILCAPPCTHFAASGAQYWDAKGNSALIHGLSIVDACLRAIVFYKPKWWALENPKGRLINYIGSPTMVFEPYEYGDPYTKLTYLWGSFTQPKKTPVDPWLGSFTHDDGGRRSTHDRSITPSGFANAFFVANP